VNDSVAGSDESSARTAPAGRDAVTQAVIEAAAELFSERNPSQVSVREIAARAGVSHSLVHRYLGTKEDIFNAALKFDRDQLTQSIASSPHMAQMPHSFDQTFPGRRYLRTVLRAALDDFPIDMSKNAFEVSQTMLDRLKEHPVIAGPDEPGFDPRLLIFAISAAVAAISIAEPVFLARAGLQSKDPEEVHAEFDRLMQRILSLAE
jgi:TetR/AcrR family transcriptional regulator, repressor for neighboring sulfatase